MNFAKYAKQKFSTEIFRVAKIIERTPRHVYELEDLDRTPIDVQFCPVRDTKCTVYKIKYWTGETDAAF